MQDVEAAAEASQTEAIRRCLHPPRPPPWASWHKLAAPGLAGRGGDTAQGTASGVTD